MTGTADQATDAAVDLHALRRARRDRVFEAMDRAGIDVLALGREDDARYATGVDRLWVAGTRPFGAGCVLVRATRQAHVLSTWDEGIPDDIPRDNLFGITWNPARMAEALRSIPGFTDARVVATDARSLGFEKAFAGLLPDAELVDGEDLIREVRRTKLPEELECIRAACAVATLGLEEAQRAAAPGVTERALVGVFDAAVAEHGTTIPASEGVAVVSDGPRLRRVPGSRQLAAGDLLVLRGGVLLDGYEGTAGWTARVGGGREGEEAAGVVASVVDRLGPGVTGAELAAPGVTIRGTGMGFEPPVITAEVGHDARLEPGMVLVVEAVAGDPAQLARAVVAIGPGGAQTL